MDDDIRGPDQHDLVTAYREVVESTTGAPDRVPPSRAGASRFTIALFVLGLGVLGYIWLGQPAWLFEAEPAVVSTPAQQEATLRFGMYLQAERIREFRREHGRLPDSLAEIAAVEEGVSYQKTGDTTFVVTASVDTLVLTLSSTDSAVDFLKPAEIRLAPIDQ